MLEESGRRSSPMAVSRAEERAPRARGRIPLGRRRKSRSSNGFVSSTSWPAAETTTTNAYEKWLEITTARIPPKAQYVTADFWPIQYERPLKDSRFSPRLLAGNLTTITRFRSGPNSWGHLPWECFSNGPRSKSRCPAFVGRTVARNTSGGGYDLTRTPTRRSQFHRAYSARRSRSSRSAQPPADPAVDDGKFFTMKKLGTVQISGRRCALRTATPRGDVGGVTAVFETARRRGPNGLATGKISEQGALHPFSGPKFRGREGVARRRVGEIYYAHPVDSVSCA